MESTKDAKQKVTPEQATEAPRSPGHGGFWVGLIMVGLLVLIIAVEMLQSKGP